MKRKTKTKDTTSCLRDFTDLPPATFALPNDGRQRLHMCDLRHRVACLLARCANADGTSVYPAVETLMKKTGRSRATIFRVLVDLRELGIVTDGELHPVRKTRVRALHLPDPSQLEPSDPSQLQNEPSHLHDDPSHLQSAPVASSRAPVSTTQPPVSPKSETQPSLDRPQTEKNRPSSDRNEKENGSDFSKINCELLPEGFEWDGNDVVMKGARQ